MAKAKPITGLEAQAPTAQNAREIARIRLGEMDEWSASVDTPYAVRELHNLRIATKRLRYTLEIFADFLSGDCKPLLKELEQIQEELGQLHDSDVLIALLRLCLGSQESPVTGQLVSRPEKQTKATRSAKSLLRPELLAELLDSSLAPTAEERYGLEQLLRKQEVTREEEYRAFRQHWYHLQERDFRRQLLGALEKEAVVPAL